MSAGGGSAGAEELGSVELVAVAKVVKVRGIKGEVVAELLTDFPERFGRVRELIGVGPTGARGRLVLERHWFHGDRVVFKFAGFDTPQESAALVGYEMAVPESEAVELQEGEFFDWQLEGCRVETVGGEPLGTVEEVLHLGGEAPVFRIRDEARGREHLVPFAESICVEVDVARKLIRVDAPEGLLEL